MKFYARLAIIISVVSIGVLLSSFYKNRKPAMQSLKVSASGRCLIKENGKSFFWLGDTGWSLFSKLTREEADNYLTDRYNKGFTIIQAHLLGWTITNQNAYGVMPFNNLNFSQPNEAYWKHVDYILDKAEELGLYMAVLPVWAGTYIENKDKIPKDSTEWPMRHDTLAAYNYAKFLGARYKNKNHIIWVLGGDVWPTKHGVYDNLAKGLTETYADNDPDKILISFHPQGGTYRPPATSTSEFYHTKKWLDFNMIQSGHRIGNKNFERIKKDYDTIPVKPTLESEPCYEQHPVEHQFDKGVFSAWHIRRRAYWAVLAGSLGFTYGANGIWQMDKPNNIDHQTHHNFYWFDALNFEGGKQMRFVRALLESRASLWQQRVPDQRLVLSTNNDVDSHIQCARADDNSAIVVYSTNGSSFDLNLSMLSKKSISAWWYNPRDGRVYSPFNEISDQPFEVFRSTARKTFDPPGEPGTANDWVLVLDNSSKSFKPPGSNKLK